MARNRKATPLYHNKGDGRYYTAVEWSDKGQPRKIYLTRDKRQSTRWLAVLEGITDHDEARQRVATLKAAQSADEEKRLLAEMLSPEIWVAGLTPELAAEQLRNLIPEFEPDDETIDAWLQADSATDQRTILLRCGADEDELNANPDIFVELAASRRRSFNQYWQTETRKSKLSEAREKARDRVAQVYFDKRLGRIGSGPTLQDCLETVSKPVMLEESLGAE